MVAICTMTFGAMRGRDDKMTTDMCTPITVLWKLRVSAWMIAKCQRELWQTGSIHIQTAVILGIRDPYLSLVRLISPFGVGRYADCSAWLALATRRLPPQYQRLPVRGMGRRGIGSQKWCCSRIQYSKLRRASSSSGYPEGEGMM